MLSQTSSRSTCWPPPNPISRKSIYYHLTAVKANAPKIHDQEPLQRIYVEELVEAIKTNDFVLFIQHNYTPHQVERVHKNTLIKSGGQFYSHRNVVYKEVFANMGLDRVQHLFITRNSLVLGKFDCLSTCVKALRRMPQFILLAGCIENELYSHRELQIIGDNPSLDMNRANLTGLLETPAIELYQNLKQYVEMHPGEADPPEGAQVVEQTNPEAEK